MLISDQFGIIQSLQMFPIPQTSFLVGTFFAAFYSKTALVYVLFWQSNMNSTRDFCPRLARKETNIPYIHKES